MLCSKYDYYYTGVGGKAQGAEGYDGAVVREGEGAHGQAGGHGGVADHDHDGREILDAGINETDETHRSSVIMTLFENGKTEKFTYTEIG